MKLLAAAGTLATLLVLIAGGVWLFPEWMAKHPYVSGIVLLIVSFTPFVRMLFGNKTRYVWIYPPILALAAAFGAWLEHLIAGR